MLSFTQLYTKGQRIAKDSNADVLTQLKEDINTGYHMFNQKLGRYYSRKQQFTDLVSGQDIYQSPLDSIRVMGMTVAINANYEPTVKEVRSEYEWRQMKSYKTFKTNWPSHYYVLGKDSIQLYPTPSQSFTNGLRFYYQPQDHDLSLDDTTSTTVTVTVTNGSTTVTASSGIFTVAMVGQKFRVEGINDISWYDIVAVPNTTTLTLKSAYVDVTNAGQSWRVAQVSIIPQEYQDAPVHYALFMYFAAQGNEKRSQFHNDQFEALMMQCQEDYSSSSMSSVITEDDKYVNPWMVTPNPAP